MEPSQLVRQSMSYPLSQATGLGLDIQRKCMEPTLNQPRITFDRFMARRLVGRLRAMSAMLLAALCIAFFWAPMGLTDWFAYVLMLILCTSVLVLPRPKAEAIAHPLTLALGIGGVAYALLLYPAVPATRVGFAIFIMLAASATTPLPGYWRTVQCFAWIALFFMLQVGTTDGLRADLLLASMVASSTTGWLLGWQNITTWREAWEDREILTHVSNQLAIQSRSLKQSIKQTRDELKNQHQMMVDQERLATLGRLAVGIGHEINNPLTVAMTNVDLARTDQDPELLDDASIALRRIRDIVKDLSQVARSDEPQELRVHTLDDVLQAAVNTGRMGLKSALHIIVDPIPHVAVRVNQRRLVQVLVNLLINAWHAMEDRGSGTIQISTEVGFGVVKVHIDDDGPGIAPSALETVFEPFYTSKPAGKGTGLGLPISRSYLRAMGGDLNARMGSLLGGARMTLSLARAAEGEVVSEVDRGTQGIAPAPSQIIESKRQQTTERPILLVVDDEPAIRRSLSKSLRRKWEVCTAAGSVEALDILREHDVDALLCDLVLTDEDAIDVLVTIQQYRPDLMAHTVLMSGEPTTGRLIDLARNNRRYLIRKPFAPMDLQDLLSAALTGHPTPVTTEFEYRDNPTEPPAPNPTTWERKKQQSGRS